MDENAFAYKCSICNENFATRSERSEHFESHLVHENCTDCNRPVIIIDDFVFELHRPLHCKASQLNIPSVTFPTIVLEPFKNIVSESEPVHESEDEDNKPIVFIQTSTELVKDDNNLKDDDDDDDNDNDFDYQEETYDDPDEYHEVEAEQKPEPEQEQNLDNENEIESLPIDDSHQQMTTRPKKRQRKPATKVKRPTKTEKDSVETKKTVRPTKLYKCTQEGCTEEFRQQKFLRIHLKDVHGVIERVYCSICNFGFTDKSNLKHHMILHTDNKRFICSFCGARFHKLTNMNEHMNAHLGLKPYKCEICGKDFGRANHKRQHLRVIQNSFL